MLTWLVTRAPWFRWAPLRPEPEFLASPTSAEWAYGERLPDFRHCAAEIDRVYASRPRPQHTKMPPVQVRLRQRRLACPEAPD